MGIYDYSDYKKYVRDWISARPKEGRGQLRKMAIHLNVSSTMMSQVFSGDKNLNLELASDLADFLGLSETETEYFFLLIDWERAGSHRLKQKLQARIKKAQQNAQKISERVAKHKELTSEERGVYYSSWLYTGVRNLLAIEKSWTTEEIASRLKVGISDVHEVIQFLIEKELVRAGKEHKYEIVSKATHLAADNPLVQLHHHNWRLRGMQKMDRKTPSNLFYTGPMSLAVSDVEKISKLILDFIQQVNKVVVDSPSETVRCLNFDWFEY